MENNPISIGISSLALLLSIISLIITLLQKNKETKRTIRKNLSDTLENITKINIEFSKLKFDMATYNTPSVIELRRNYNSQRRILIAHADYLVTENNDLATEIDCNLLAGAYSAIGDYLKADYYWVKTINKSQSNAIKHMNLRGYARFLFFQGKPQVGRSNYEQALKLDIADTDDNRRQITDTYIMWATVENEFNNETEAKRLIDLARGYSSRIGNKKMREEMDERINRFSTLTN
jgi:tetratricopeptide (TPR) repeat protein